MFEQVFKNLDDVLWKEAACNTELEQRGLNTVEYKMGELFGEIKNKFQSGFGVDVKTLRSTPHACIGTETHAQSGGHGRQ
jgi:hypothetical protein